MAAEHLRAQRFIHKLPIFKRLPDVPAKAKQEARNEVVTTTIIASLPFWLPLFISLITFEIPFSFAKGVAEGDLLIYAATLVAPVAYIITRRYGKWFAASQRGNEEYDLTLSFPEGLPIVILSILICVLSAAVLTLRYTSPVFEYEPWSPRSFGVVILSLVFALLSSGIIYSVAAYRNFIENLTSGKAELISNAQREDEQSFFEEWRERQEAENGD